MITAKEARELWDYNQRTGVLKWKPRHNGGAGDKMFNTKHAGKAAGCPNADGYLIVAYKRKAYYVHRLAVLIVTGKWPTHEVDHWNEDKADNRWRNLREATKSQNKCNVGITKANTTGAKGVRKRGTKWEARIMRNSESVKVGLFATIDEAIAAHAAAAKKLHREFARTK